MIDQMSRPGEDPHRPNIHEVWHELGRLRRQFGDQPWLTVVSDVTAHGYRLAGFTAEEFHALLTAQCCDRGRLPIHLRRKPIMRLREGLDGKEGAIGIEAGVATLELHFGAGSYMEDEGAVLTMSAARLPSSLLITGGLNRPIGRVLPEVPRCLASAGPRVGRIGREVTEWSERIHVRLERRWETLGTMPDDVSRSLGLEPQRSVRHIPWLGVEDHGLPATTLAPAAQRPRPGGPRPKRPRLRLVSSR
jgi:hypothetical protein